MTAERGGFVLLVGGSSVGKTRTAVEASRIGRRVQQDDAEGSELSHDQVSELLGTVAADSGVGG